MARLVVLLDGPIRSDARVIRAVRSLSRLGRVDLYHPEEREGDRGLFDDRVRLHPVNPTAGSRSLPRRCLTLHREFDFLAEAVLASGKPCDLVYANDYPTLAPARRIAAARGAALVYDAHEIYLETVNQFFPTGAAWPRRLVFRLLTFLARRAGRRVERRLLRDADLFLTTNPHYARHFAETYGVDDAVIVMNCPSREAVPERERPPGAGGSRTVLYQGVMNLGRGLEELVRSAAWFDPGIRLSLIGYGMLEGRLREIAREEGLGDRVTFGGRVEYERLLEHTVAADLGVLILDPVNLSKRYASANKIFDYMACGVPVLATDLPENRRILTECESGFLVATREPERLAAEINRVLADPDGLSVRGENGRKAFLTKYNWEEQEKVLLDAVSRILGERTASR